MLREPDEPASERAVRGMFSAGVAALALGGTLLIVKPTWFAALVFAVGCSLVLWTTAGRKYL